MFYNLERKDDERSPKLSGPETESETPMKEGKPAKQKLLLSGMSSGSNTPSDGNVRTSSDGLATPNKHSKKKPGMSDNVRVTEFFNNFFLLAKLIHFLHFVDHIS